ncbi:UxaA family hydrolase [Bacillus alkalicellulosilyticus]|uniref:UxaA family hydrolase n=1 Tax=Alkalihalobacterium alkalicellulosilyticum TaxID=1912214 RepID=UPI00099622F9|nr:UxaA family hydrolase [Bacillus alkalicellulosilyticus]
MENRRKTVMMKPKDKVAVALDELDKGNEILVECQGNTFKVNLKDSISFGHKFAVVSIAKGEDIVKYGEVIGVAVKDIAVGEHVHIHNLEGKRGRGDKVGL